MIALGVQAQNDQGSFSGALEANGNIFIRDTEIGAAGIPQYDRQKFGAETWLNLNYRNWGFDVGVRFDLFNNSNLLNPNSSYTDQGIGRWFIKKSINKLHISAGYLYDQIGSGIIFRTYEERPLLIDNALYGARLVYDLSDDWSIKAFTGRHKKQFELHDPIVKGASIEGFLSFGEESPVTLAPGIGMVNRTFDDGTMESIVGVLTNYLEIDRFKPKYNVYATSLYNTLSVKKWTWYIEGAIKSDDVFVDPNVSRTLFTGAQSLGKLVGREGSVLYSSLSYAAKGIGITIEGKRTENFVFRTDPFQALNNGFVSFIPPMFRQNTYRLTARYSPATQEIGELAYQVDVLYALNKKWSFEANFSNITDLDDNLLYREYLLQALYKYERKWQLIFGVQRQEYDQDVYQGKPGVPMVEAITPYAEWLYRFSRKRALRVELQYMNTDEDFGSWVFALAEYSIAPHWLFEVSDMYNIDPKKTDKLHYPTVGIVYSNKSNRFAARYVKQVEGVVCTGGICRLEPAF